MCGVHCKKKNPNITDRAKRYRAQKNVPAGKNRCTFCASGSNTVIDHVNGNESDGKPENLMRLCKSCNTRKGLTQARHRVGIRTRQYNPARIPTFRQFHQAASVLLGVIPGNVAQATQTVLQTPPETRERYADKIEAVNPFKSDAQRRKFFAMAARGEIAPAVLKKFMQHNPAAPTFAQYAHGVSIHQRGTHDEGGVIIHATPPELRKTYARKIAQIKQERRR